MGALFGNITAGKAAERRRIEPGQRALGIAVGKQTPAANDRLDDAGIAGRGDPAARLGDRRPVAPVNRIGEHDERDIGIGDTVGGQLARQRDGTALVTGGDRRVEGAARHRRLRRIGAERRGKITAGGGRAILSNGVATKDIAAQRRFGRGSGIARDGVRGGGCREEEQGADQHWRRVPVWTD